MKREIRFRGISVESKEFIYGHLMCHKNFIEEKYYIKEDSKNPIVWHEVKSETVGQFTGLHDKNGKEIYEGDVLRWTSSNPFSKGEIRTVKVDYTQAQFWCNGISPKRFGVYLAELLVNEKCEVIGNIHENPELL